MSCSINEYKSRIGLFTHNFKPKPKNLNTKTPLKTTTKFTTFLLILFTLMPIYPNTSYPTHKIHNKTQHSLNGNSYLSLVHWNKGRSLFHNKTNNIDHILSLHKPHIFSICKANAEMTMNDTPFSTYLDYKIEHTKMPATTNRSHNILLIKDDIIYNRRHGLPYG